MGFTEKVYELTKKIPCGCVSTYGGVAYALGSPKACRAVGNILNKNLDAPIVPCHRIVCSDGKVGGFALGTKKKIELLKKEGIKIKNNKIIGFEKILVKF